MSQIKTAAEMLTIRQIDAKIREKEKRNFVSEPVAYDDKASFVVSRCIRGPQGWVGLFKVCELIQNGKKTERKVLANGVDMVVVMSSIEDAVRRKVYK